MHCIAIIQGCTWIYGTQKSLVTMMWVKTRVEEKQCAKDTFSSSPMCLSLLSRYGPWYILNVLVISSSIQQLPDITKNSEFVDSQSPDSEVLVWTSQYTHLFLSCKFDFFYSYKWRCVMRQGMGIYAWSARIAWKMPKLPNSNIQPMMSEWS